MPRHTNKKSITALDDFNSQTFDRARHLSAFWPTTPNEISKEKAPDETSGIIVRKSHRHQNWFFKNTATVPRFSYKLTKDRMQETFEFEAAVSEIWRYLIGERAPKNRCVTDDAGTTIGLISKEIPGFKTAFELYINDPTFFSTLHFIEYDIASILMATYFLEDIDFNIQNWGFSDILNRFVKIDHGWSMASLIGHEFKAELTDSSNRAHIITRPRMITPDDIEQLPKINTQHWHNWLEPDPKLIITEIPLRKGFMAQTYERRILNMLSGNEKFRHQKYHMCLKILLMPQSVIIRAANLHIQSRININAFTAFFNKRKTELLTALIASDEFCAFMSQMDEDLDDFKADAKAFLANNRKFQAYDLDNAIEENYTGIVSHFGSKLHL